MELEARFGARQAQRAAFSRPRRGYRFSELALAQGVEAMQLDGNAWG